MHVGVRKEERGGVHGEPNCVYRILNGSMYCVIMCMCVDVCEEHVFVHVHRCVFM